MTSSSLPSVSIPPFSTSAKSGWVAANRTGSLLKTKLDPNSKRWIEKRCQAGRLAEIACSPSRDDPADKSLLVENRASALTILDLGINGEAAGALQWPDIDLKPIRLWHVGMEDREPWVAYFPQVHFLREPVFPEHSLATGVIFKRLGQIVCCSGYKAWLAYAEGRSHGNELVIDNHEERVHAAAQDVSPRRELPRSCSLRSVLFEVDIDLPVPLLTTHSHLEPVCCLPYCY